MSTRLEHDTFNQGRNLDPGKTVRVVQWWTQTGNPRPLRGVPEMRLNRNLCGMVPFCAQAERNHSEHNKALTGGYLPCGNGFQCYKWFWSCVPLWTAACLHSVSYATLFFWKPRMLEIQQYKGKTHGFRTFSCFGPHIWNSLPQDLRCCSTLSSFKAKLKTFLFSQYFHPNWY